MNVSVCIATFNGEKYILSQLKSIIGQLKIDDEIIIVDDCSTDNTVGLIETLIDKRIKLFKNDSNLGHIYSFEKSIDLASKDIIFMSDQDDIWSADKIEIMLNKLCVNSSLLITSNQSLIDSNGDNYIGIEFDGTKDIDSHKYVKNIFSIFIGKSGYFGCTMAFKRELKNVILPFPSLMESHDLWIAMAANLMGSNLHCNEITLFRRIHGDNFSVINRNIFLKIISRFIFIHHILVLIKRILINKFK